jgi:hypothetical protein
MTVTHGLHLRVDPSRLLSAFSDADWAASSEDRRSTRGHAIFYGPNLIIWSTRKQATISRSSIESEYKALANATAELIWLLSLLWDLVFHRSVHRSFGVTISVQPTCHQIKFFMLAQSILRLTITLCISVLHKSFYISFEDQLADLFTKPFPLPLFEACRRNLNLGRYGSD